MVVPRHRSLIAYQNPRRNPFAPIFQNIYKLLYIKNEYLKRVEKIYLIRSLISLSIDLFTSFFAATSRLS